jgi:acetyl-CoA C-acetyltransferase
MGEHCERMAQTWRIGRAEQDELALLSHQKLAAAYAEGWQDDLLTPFLGPDPRQQPAPRPDPGTAGQAQPAFDRSGQGTLTPAIPRR